MMEGLKLPYDVIHYNVCKHLFIVDILRAQQVCKSWLHCFLADGAFIHIKRHILTELPNLSFVFERFPWKYETRIPELVESEAKKRKKSWIMPKGGTWYVLKTWIACLKWRIGLKAMLNRKKNKDVQMVMVGEMVRGWFLTREKNEKIQEKILKEKIVVILEPCSKWSCQIENGTVISGSPHFRDVDESIGVWTHSAALSFPIDYVGYDIFYKLLHGVCLSEVWTTFGYDKFKRFQSVMGFNV